MPGFTVFLNLKRWSGFCLHVSPCSEPQISNAARWLRSITIVCVEFNWVMSHEFTKPFCSSMLCRLGERSFYSAEVRNTAVTNTLFLPVVQRSGADESGPGRPINFHGRQLIKLVTNGSFLSKTPVLIRFRIKLYLDTL